MIPAKSQAVIMDSWAIIAYLEDEKAAGKIGDIIVEAHESGIPLLMTVVNAGEVWYTVARKASESDADGSLKDLAELGISIVDVDWTLTHTAAKFKTRGRIAYADCFAAALAKREAGPLVTGDPEFKLLEKDISILWMS